MSRRVSHCAGGLGKALHQRATQGFFESYQGNVLAMVVERQVGWRVPSLIRTLQETSGNPNRNASKGPGLIKAPGPCIIGA